MDMSVVNTLKNCPFCGGSVSITQHNDEIHIDCNSCIAGMWDYIYSSDIDTALIELVNTWNKRV